MGAITTKKEKREGHFKELTTEYETVSKDFETSQEAFKRHELTDSKLMEEMKSLNNKRKKTKTHKLVFLSDLFGYSEKIFSISSNNRSFEAAFATYFFFWRKSNARIIGIIQGYIHNRGRYIDQSSNFDIS